MDQQTIAKVQAAVDGAVALLEVLEASGVPGLAPAVHVAGEIRAQLAAGGFDPRSLIPPAVADIRALAGEVTDPLAKYLLNDLAARLGKFGPPAPAAA